MPTSTSSRYEENETSLLLAAVLAAYNVRPKNDQSLVYREVVIGKYNAPARADLALINKKRLTLIECKGERDNLSRLPSQVRYYDMVADLCHLLCSGCHIEKAKTILPEYWGIVAPNHWKQLKIIRDPNPVPQKLYNPWLALEMLWTEDLKAIGYSSNWKGARKITFNPDLQFLFDNQECGLDLKIERWNELKKRHQARVIKLLRKQISLRLQAKNIQKRSYSSIKGYNNGAELAACKGR